MNDESILKKWRVSEAQLTSILHQNPRARAMLGGRVAKERVKEILASNPDVESVSDVQGRADIVQVMFRGELIRLRVLALDPPTAQQHKNSRYRYQCRTAPRKVTPENGTTAVTDTPIAEYDAVAVSLFEVGQRWQFAYCMTSDLRKSAENGGIAAVQGISLPMKRPYGGDVFALLAAIRKQRKSLAGGTRRRTA